MISIEKLFLLISPSGMPVQIIQGRGVFSRNDAENLIAQAQSKFPVGVKVLEASISGIEQSAFTLRETIKSALLSDGMELPVAKAMSKMVIHEVCGTKVCPKCKGRGYTHTNREGPRRQLECRKCFGVGRIIMDCKALAGELGKQLEREVTEEEFRAGFYDTFSSAVDALHRESWDAERECKRLLRIEAGEYAA
ncbi:hypothetical protein I6M38_11525 [Shewanella algae]|uniref:hypothetical protein n=1 Tax=Shewanella algae TaxID=38313 RepID=UPI001AACBB45|nr:hypothetical protein [Shewanella algae]MBO2552609.1 hypothetical protein [Shewanella algae]MBO2582501.1 hypothetical protein [Shewanella algae]